MKGKGYLSYFIVQWFYKKPTTTPIVCWLGDVPARLLGNAGIRARDYFFESAIFCVYFYSCERKTGFIARDVVFANVILRLTCSIKGGGDFHQIFICFPNRYFTGNTRWALLAPSGLVSFSPCFSLFYLFTCISCFKYLPLLGICLAAQWNTRATRQ